MTSRTASGPVPRASTSEGSERRALDDLTIYEDRFARLVSSARAVAFANGRTALAAVLRAARLQPGDEVLLSPLTCKVVPLTLLSLHLKPVFADVSAATLNLDAARLDPLAGPRTRAVLFQHTYGSPKGIDQVAAWTQARGLLLVEDCAQSMPLPYPAGSDCRGHAAIFSNNLLKPLPAGSGGLAVTDDSEFARAIERDRACLPTLTRQADRRLKLAAFVHDRLLRPRSYWPLLSLYERFDNGYRHRSIAEEIRTEIEDASCAPSAYQVRRGLGSLDVVDRVTTERRRATADYARAMSALGHVEIPDVDASLPLYYFPVLVRDKATLLKEARRENIEIVAWPRRTPIYPIDDSSRLAAYGYEPGSCLAAESVAARLVGLPTYGRITTADRARIVDLLRGLR